jgi:putative two-component system response regulator
MLQDSLLPSLKILIVDDEPVNVIVLEQFLQEDGYTQIKGVTDPRLVPALLEDYRPDLVVLDLLMPHMDGFQVLRHVTASLPPGTYLPVLVLTADATLETRRRALEHGATDFLIKPFDEVEVLLRIKNLLRTRHQHVMLHHVNAHLEQKVEERTQTLLTYQRDLELSQLEVLQRLARAAEYRDDETGQHTHRVGRTAAMLAQLLGSGAMECELIECAAPLHDVGKIGISDLILLKPGKLTPQEFDVIKTHTTIGAGILSGGQSDIIQMAESIALTHHERWDGTGYPQGLSGENIPLIGRIVAVADVFDAFTHDRPYKRAWPVEDAVREITAQRGRQFDAGVVDSFLTLQHQNLI